MENVATVLRGLNLPAEEIAVRSGLTTARILEILDGVSATLPELRSLSRGLRIPLHTFAAGQSTKRTGDIAILFRGSAHESAPYNPTVEHVASFVEAALEILPPQGALPDWLFKFKPQAETFIEAHRLAYLFREIFSPERGDEPILDLADIAVNRASVIISRLVHSRYEGASLIAGGYCFIFVSPRFTSRMLFTLAHELGHLLAHNSTGSGPIFERLGQIGRARQTSRSERFVDAFASVLLMPDTGVGRALKAIREAVHIKADQIGDVELLYLARIFGVSFEVAARRCETLDLLPKGAAFSLAKHLTTTFGSPERRADELGLPSRPEIYIPRLSRNLLDRIVHLCSAGEISIGWAVDRFGVTVDDIFAANSARRREHNH